MRQYPIDTPHHKWPGPSSAPAARGTDDLGHTALNYAVMYCDEMVVRLLLTSGAKHDIMTAGGDTALTLAILAGNDPILRLLGEHAAKLVSIKSVMPQDIFLTVSDKFPVRNQK